MRNAILVSILAAVVIVASVAAYAGPPLNGNYSTLNNDFDNGRYAASWAPGGGGYLSVGDVLHAESWNGSSFGGDWKILCPAVVNVTLVVDLTFGGNGQKIYQIDYAGGMIELSGTGPWGNGDPQYTGLIDNYTEFRTVQYSNNVITGAVSNHAVSAHLQGYTASCMTWGIGNGALVGMSPAAKPADYPDFRDGGCSSTAGEGDWGNFTDLTLSVQGCAVATQQSTWGGIKSMYRK